MSNNNCRIVVIGAGMAGILAGIKLREAGYKNICIYEKANDVGGTWRENTYPGLHCDVPAHHYTYSFERNPDWTRHLSPGAEIQGYLQGVTQKYGLYEIIKFNNEIVQAKFLHGHWLLELADGQSDKAQVVIAATGVLHQPLQPDIPGIDSFAGDIFHTARWDHSKSLQGKRVGVVGMGSTGVQIVSELTAREVAVSHFVRSPQWIMPVENGTFSEAERKAFKDDPQLLNDAMDFAGYASAVEQYTQALIDSDSAGAKALGQACRENLSLNVLDPGLQKQLLPDHQPLCKRLIFSPDYYQAIQRDCARLIRNDIKAIEAAGIRTKDGELHKLEVIAFATGFRTNQFMRPMLIGGRDGIDLEDYWSPSPLAYLSVSMPGFPNFFMLNGPNGPVGNYSLIDIAEHQWGYISQLIEKISSAECAEISPSVRAAQTLETERIEAAKKTIWYTGGCQSWYLDVNGIPASWPWSYTRFVDEMRCPKWDAFEMR